MFVGRSFMLEYVRTAPRNGDTALQPKAGKVVGPPAAAVA
jgi:hypothetical protein